MSRNQGKLSGRNKSVLPKKRPCKGATVGTYSTASSGDSISHRASVPALSPLHADMTHGF